MNRLSFERPTQLDNYLKPHSKERREEVNKLLGKLSSGNQSSSHVVDLKKSISTVVAWKPLHRIRLVSVPSVYFELLLFSWCDDRR